MFGDTDKLVAEKVKAAVGAGLGVIACVGESLEQRESNQTKEVVERQLNAIAGDIPEEAWKWVFFCFILQ
jgi:triosephosphate isomerase